jgi:hypothetical protein
MMKNGLFNKRIPTLLVILTLIVVIVISTVLIQSGIFYVGRASQDGIPRNFLITNVSDSTFTAVFTTTAQSEAVVILIGAATGNVVTLDDRDKKSGVKNKYYSHHITVHNLKPNTKYLFKLLSLGKEYQSTEYFAITGPEIATDPPAQNPLFGKVLMPDGSTASDTIVTAKTSTSSLASAVTNNKGEFILPTNSLRTSDAKTYNLLTNSDLFLINLYRIDLKAHVSSTFLLAQNLPVVTLSQEYSFSENNSEKTVEENKFNFTQETLTGKTVDIVVPEEGEAFADTKPQFSGTSYPNSNVTVTISGQAPAQVTANASGVWKYTPLGIAQGNQKISISVIDNKQQTIEESRNFTIFPSGSQVTESATPSATVTPTIKPTAKPTPTPTPTPTSTPTPTPQLTLVPSPSPTIQVTPTPTPTITPSPTPLPTIPTTPTPTPSISPPGEMQNTFILSGLSVILIVAGAVLLFAL